ncbi:MAG: iron-only hydrogenase system regulator [Clostridia bacterium]|nr:iron-only hydrogenase system regulator [Clostridia bacterium]
MENRVAIIGIIVEEYNAAMEVNTLLHEFGEYVIGRMGIPYRERKISMICVMLDAPNDIISALSGKLGMIRGVSSKTLYSKT